MAYATLADLEEYLGASPELGDERRLERASEIIDLALVGVTYAVDSNQLPTAATVADALMRATCEQVSWWRSTGDEIGDSALYQSVTLGPATLTQRLGDRAGGQTASGVPRVAPKAKEILHTAGLRKVATVV